MTPDDVLTILYRYRCDLFDASVGNAAWPIPPALPADALVDAYGAAMNRYGAEYMTFAEWLAWQQEPQGPRRFVVVGGRS